MLKYSLAAPKSVPAFVRSLWNCVNDPTNDAIIRWSKSGNKIEIHDMPRFKTEVLAAHFPDLKFGSFRRYLNLYGFPRANPKEK